MSIHLTPADVAECLIAPIEELGPMFGYSAKTAYHWRRPSKYRAAGDIPHHAMRAILAHARRKRIPLTPEHMIWGAPWAEIDEILRARGDVIPPRLRARLAASDVAAE